jgi:hypothetical protein
VTSRGGRQGSRQGSRCPATVETQGRLPPQEAFERDARLDGGPRHTVLPKGARHGGVVWIARWCAAGRVGWVFTFAAAAYRLVRLPKFLAEAT